MQNNKLHTQPECRERNSLAKFHWYNFSWQTINHVVSGVFLIFFWVFLARMWPKATFGQFNALFVWVTIYSLVTDLGIDFWITKQTALIKHGSFARNLVAFKLLSAMIIGLCFLLAGFLAGLPIVALGIFLSGTYVLNISNFFSCYLRGREKLAVEAKLSIIRSLVFIGISVAAVSMGAGLVSVALSFGIANCIGAILTCKALKAINFEIAAENIDLAAVIKSAMGIWLTAILAGLSIRLDIILLGVLLDEPSVATYSAASRILEGIIQLAIAFVLTIIPSMSIVSVEHPKLWLKNVLAHGKLLVMMSLILSLAGVIAGKILFIRLYGPEYAESADLFVKMMLVFPISALIFYLYNVLVIAGHSTVVIVVLFSGLAINLVLDWWLIPHWQLNGAFTGYTVKEVAVLCCLLYFTFRLRPRQPSIT